MSYFNRGLLGVTMPNFLLGNSGKSTMRKEENVYQETHNPAEVKEHACGPAELKVRGQGLDLNTSNFAFSQG